MKSPNKGVIINTFVDDVFLTVNDVLKLRPDFTKLLLQWNEFDNNREMPWKNEKDPYRIWLSEIILQQTRVEQGTAYYDRFITQYPSVKHLAHAAESDIFKLWEGLGYYSRCRNLIATAKYIADELNGEFPADHESLLKLKGVGPYTAAAIASFAFNLPHAVVDGNVMRLLSRVFGIDVPIDSGIGKKYFTELANNLLGDNEPAAFNQAMMDFGATVCKPRQPRCTSCIFNASCVAFNNEMIAVLPVKQNKMVRKTRWFYYIILQSGTQFYIRKRTAKDIWQNLHEFILAEKDEETDPQIFVAEESIRKLIGQPFKVVHISEPHMQHLTHQTIKGYFIHVQAKKLKDIQDHHPVTKAHFRRLAFPKFITGYITGEGSCFFDGEPEI